MNTCTVHLTIFSPTHAPKQVGEAIVRGTGVSRIIRTGLTSYPAGKLEILENILAVITALIYDGKVVPLALERIGDIHTSGASAVLVVVHGNRAYEEALAELNAFASERGSRVVVGGMFAGEHLYSVEQDPIVVGRPDVGDLQFAETFGAKIRTKIEVVAEMGKLYAVDVSRTQRLYQAFFLLFRFLWEVMKLHKDGVPMPRISVVDIELCSHYGYCAVHCLTSAIRRGDECYTDAEKCIRCCVCVKGCSQKTRTFNAPFAALLVDCFKR